jgi:hypothetical protein
MVGVKKLPPVNWFRFAPLPLDTKGALNGMETRELYEILRIVRSGSANRFIGREVRELCDRSKEVKAVRSPNVAGSEVSLLLCN